MGQRWKIKFIWCNEIYCRLHHMATACECIVYVYRQFITHHYSCVIDCGEMAIKVCVKWWRKCWSVWFFFTIQRARQKPLNWEKSVSSLSKEPKAGVRGINTLEQNHPEEERVRERHSSSKENGPVLIKPFLFHKPASQRGGGHLISGGFGSPRWLWGGQREKRGDPSFFLCASLLLTK